MKICIGIPTTGITKTETTGCLMDLAVAIFKKYGFYSKIIANGPVEQARNSIVDKFLETDCTHLLFVDWDATFPEDSAEVLADADKPVIGCNAAKKKTGDPVVVKNIEGEVLDYIRNEIEHVDFIGMHVTMIRREVFEIMPWPWFMPTALMDQRVMGGEDITFCKKAHELHGQEVWVHNMLSLQVEHIADVNLNLNAVLTQQIETTKKELYEKELQKLSDDLCRESRVPIDLNMESIKG